jgi:hypothetical protein
VKQPSAPVTTAEPKLSQSLRSQLDQDATDEKEKVSDERVALGEKLSLKSYFLFSPLTGQRCIQGWSVPRGDFSIHKRTPYHTKQFCSLLEPRNGSPEDTRVRDTGHSVGKRYLKFKFPFAVGTLRRKIAQPLFSTTRRTLK